MKTLKLLVLLVVIYSTTACSENEDYETVLVATPEYMSKTAFRSSVDILPPTPIVESGKIYVYNNLVLVNDQERGIHIIDNTDPTAPQVKTFIEILANKDMEVKGNYLYADSLMDLLVFDISDLNDIREVARLEDVFPAYINLPFVDNLIVEYQGANMNTGDLLVSWNIREERRKISDMPDGIMPGGMLFDAVNATAESTGQGGSLARFKIVDDYLYAVDSHNINIFNIDDLEKPVELSDVYAGFDIETIFNRDNLLFLGSMRGMYIYDISKPDSPIFISEFEHGTACDPVVVDDKYAFITLRAGNFCGAFESSLEIVDISDIYNLKRVESYTMDNPYGLGLRHNLLFICDGTSGLKVYDRTDVHDLKLLDTFKQYTAYDVIPLANSLLMIGDNTLYQFNYDEEGLKLLSTYTLN